MVGETSDGSQVMDGDLKRLRESLVGVNLDGSTVVAAQISLRAGECRGRFKRDIAEGTSAVK